MDGKHRRLVTKTVGNGDELRRMSQKKVLENHFFVRRWGRTKILIRKDFNWGFITG
jgi:hypothetical protein